jgi:RNA polymerase sigma-70 factor (ECF subfamily)
VFAIARHVFLMQRRSTARRLRFHDSLVAEGRLGLETGRDEAAVFVDRDAVARALDTIPADQRRAVLMHHVEGWSFSEIADRLGIRANAAKTRAFRGVKRMREHLSRG